MTRTLAVVGNGPAALYLTVLMANRGWRVRLFDPKMPMEMKRGGAIALDALADFPRFEGYKDAREIDVLKVHSPKGHNRVFEFPRPLKLVSRDQLISYLTRLLLDTDAEIYPGKLDQVVRKGGKWLLKTSLKEEEADFVVGADGAAAFACKTLGIPRLQEELTIEVGYDLPMPLETGRVGLVQFLPDLPGAFWALPSAQGGTHLRLWATSKQLHARNLFERADVFVHNLFGTSAPTDSSRQASHVPIYRRKKIPFIGDGWALISEAAGFVNPLSQDGLYFGLQSAALLALSFDDKGLDARMFRKRINLQVYKPLRRLMRRARLWKSSFFLDWTIARAQKKVGALNAMLGLLDPRH